MISAITCKGITDMKVFRHLGRSFRRSSLIRSIEVSKRKMLRASDAEKIKYELELMAFRKQIRLLDNTSFNYPEA